MRKREKRSKHCERAYMRGGEGGRGRSQNREAGSSSVIADVVEEGGGSCLIEYCAHCDAHRGVLALFARPFYALGAFSERQCKYHKAPKAGIYWGVAPAPCEQPTTLSVSVTGKESH